MGCKSAGRTSNISIFVTGNFCNTRQQSNKTLQTPTHNATTSHC